MFEILARFFSFCNAENRQKFYASIALGVLNSLFMALRIAAVAVTFRALIATMDGVAFSALTVWQSLGIMTASIVGAIITKKNMSMLQTEAGYRTCAGKRIEIAEHLRYLPMGYFNATSLGEITSVTTNTMELLVDVATRAVMMVTQGLLDSTLIIAMIFFFDARIALVALSGFLIFELVNLLLRFSVRGVSERKHKADTLAVEKILEYIQGIAEVKAYNLTGSRRKALDSVIDSQRDVNLAMEMRCIPISALQSLVAKLTGCAIMLCSLKFYLSGTMALSDCALMIVCAFMLFGALEAGGNYAALLRVIDIGVQKANAILDLPAMDIDGKEIKESKTLDIEAKNVSFSYGKKKIIDNISLKIPEKTTTAIVGASGSGKTTLCHLLARFWDVDSGEVTLGGVNVKDFSMDSLMSNFSFVFQNVYLFHDTIAENIRFGSPSTPMEKVIEAAKKACCHDFISALPAGYDTVIGEGGASLSGGERQRISIARAILKDAPIIVLDEATANVDPENERDLMQAVSALTKEKTVIMIAHRLKTVRHASNIIVLDRGKIAEQGRHEELVNSGGIYSRFISSRRQAVSWKL